jgi:hypothetical protein
MYDVEKPLVVENIIIHSFGRRLCDAFVVFVGFYVFFFFFFLLFFFFPSQREYQQPRALVVLVGIRRVGWHGRVAALVSPEFF